MKQIVTLAGHLRIPLIGLCTVLVIASAFTERHTFLALVTTALGVIVVLRLTNLRVYTPATRLAIMCLLCAIFVISGWKKHWVGFVIIAFIICSILIVRESLALFRHKAGGPGLTNPK